MHHIITPRKMQTPQQEVLALSTVAAVVELEL
jgi:hypothetical protein